MNSNRSTGATSVCSVNLVLSIVNFTTVKSTIDRRTDEMEVAPVLQLEFIYSYTARLVIADLEDPMPDYIEGRSRENTDHPTHPAYRFRDKH